MPFNLRIPKSGGTSLDLTVNPGDSLFILGANGSGKSSIMQRFYCDHMVNARRISAHRQTWFSSNSLNLSPEQKRNTENNIRQYDADRQARWRDSYSEQRATIAIYNIIDAENVRARAITSAVDNDNLDLAKTLAKEDAPIRIINELLRLSNIPIEISVHANEQVVASKSGGSHYSIAELSDGERNALLIAATVLTVKEETLLLIDEPERHLHRSIISPLLTLLFSRRPDCAFVISTHDLMLPLDNPQARTLLIRDCTYTDNTIRAWDADLVSPDSVIDDDIKKDIFGARKKILFIEGNEHSLDMPLYSLLFPNTSVIAKSGCRDVEHAVSSIRDAADLHWIKAFGIIDNDRRSQDEIERLKTKGIYAVSLFSVESLYYHPEIQCKIAERQAAVTGQDAATKISNAKAAALVAITPHIQRLCERTAEKAIREEFFRHLPRKNDIAAATQINISIDIAPIIAAERSQIKDALSAGDLTMIISKYPIRETPALTEIANKLGFQNRDHYQRAVRKLLMDDEASLIYLRTFFDTLAADIDAA